ncbi:MAG: penicillin-binding protein 2 [Flavobacteriaceae bacterium CG_4_8_14_3_um_filter_34_10]|nr:penicillin-binding protein 2 [Flavobacteriia bacterium]OIP51096.1 MAG: penicillin-binding protein 2 [Flavobacteriaceae bacterium CG2_30_34_30]PIQ16925.1 MAG: penicillin-binding protein 2 [Flavobacteriaceae bacterium CG18_big_fil_WC_8_21_14_2_50_34_36]PIV49257.1 MAG: penicillin-binding protein 2 [Flavobacteriaceae bacterium CG02_land_8_20_14_3_00_34_13]PIX10679.1 MAG: penicillin-binding protein 2 [Flavobacteriaceae bacterium CG_4_8_14_3_um_filter_34_10]PIZ07463.1 MAG: penicillin-binding prot
MRKLLLYSLVIFTGILFTARLLYLQVFDSSFQQMSEINAVSVVYDYPQRGYVYDRHGKLLVANQPSYDVMVIPRNIKKLDTLEFCKMLHIEKAELNRILEKARIYSPRLPSVVLPQLTKDEYAYLQEKMYKYPGFYIQKRTLRDYQVTHSGNILGYIAEVNPKTIEENPYYQMGDLIGVTGVESQYEEILRGVKGVKYIQKDRFNRDIGAYKEGVFDTLPKPGQDITLSIDETLQAYGELLMKNKRGGIVAIEPETGEILALVSAPGYDPALLVGRQRSKNYTALYQDSIAKPLYDRGLLAEYAPGSTFKIMNALIALEENVIDENNTFSCNHGYSYGRGRKMGCHSHPSPVNLNMGIYESCNAYFANIYRRIIEKYPTPQEGIDVWSNHLKSFGLGGFLGNDLPIGRPGKIPTAAYYNKIYNFPTYKWFSTATISNAIGQGEVITTPIQLANMTAAIANRGFYITPHVIKEIDGKPMDDPTYTEKKFTTVHPQYFEPIIEGMFDVYNKGTASRLQVEGIEICGKTGTAENFTKIDGKKTQLTDHSIFIAFAPKDNPKIAIAIFVENGYWGGRYAGRIAGLMIEKYLKGSITRTDMEEWVLSRSLEEEYAKPLSGKPFRINQ